MNCTHENCSASAATELRVKHGPGEWEYFDDYASCKAHAELRAAALKESLADESALADAIQAIPYRPRH